MSSKKELEQKLRLSDQMVVVQGLMMIEDGLRLLSWSELSRDESNFLFATSTHVKEFKIHILQDEHIRTLYRRMKEERN